MRFFPRLSLIVRKFHVTPLFGKQNQEFFDKPSDYTGNEFDDLGYREYLVPMIRIVTNGSNVLGPATLLVEGVGIKPFDAGILGLLALEKIDGKKVYPQDACTYFTPEKFQYRMPIPALVSLYQKAADLGVKSHSHNELRLGENQVIPCVMNMKKVDVAVSLLKEMVSQKRDFSEIDVDHLCHYNPQSGKFYHLEKDQNNYRLGEELVLPRNVLSLDNLAQNQEMQLFVDRALKVAASDAADEIIQQYAGKIPLGFCAGEKGKKPNEIFRLELQKALDEKMKDPATQVLVKNSAKIKSSEEFLSNH